MKNNRNSSGFHLIMIPLIVVVLGIIGFAGWYVWQVSQNNKSVTENNGLNTTPTLTPTESVKEFMTIQEWGIKIPLTVSIANATYKIEGDSYAFLYIPIEGDTDGYCSYQAGVSKNANPSNDPNAYWADRKDALDQYASKIGGIYYLITAAPMGSECSKDSIIQAKASSVQSEWLKQAKLIETIN